MNATFDRARIARDAGPALALFAAVLLLAWAIAYWAWRWVTPAPVHVMPEPSNPVAAIVASGWLASDAHAVPDASAPATLAGDVRLLGVFAEANGGGYALFRLPSGPKLVKKGGEIESGSTLVDIAPWTIRIRDAGGERNIALLAATASAMQASAGRLPPTARRAAGCTPPPGFSGQVVKLNAELLQGLATQPAALRAIVAPVAGGMSVREASGFAQMIGLKPGDRVRLANGIPLASADDVMAAVLTPLLANQPVRLSGTRDGQAREMLLLNAGACPG
ncbi:MAG TPA: hypothetical protein VIL19_10005 [Casimicrobiaceae bacterium]